MTDHHTSQSDTIVALSSGQGRAAVAVVRASGPSVRTLLQATVGRVPTPRMAELLTIRLPNGQPLDTALVLFFPNPASFTGEDLAEFQLHGSRAVVQNFLKIACLHAGVRIAQPGEYTQRAFDNGKLDLLAVEDLADLIDSETELQRRLAGGEGRGRFRAFLNVWREGLLSVLAVVEAQIDFSDEDDVPAGLFQELQARLAGLRKAIADALVERVAAERIREGFQVVIAGPPNAGKSSLLNALAGRDVAIVSPIAGTTRDVLEVRLDLDGIPILLRDVAGIRESVEVVERMGIDRARSAMATADLVLWLDPVDEPALPQEALPVGSVRIISKTDLASSAVPARKLAISTQTGHGIVALLDEIRGRAAQDFRFGEATIMLNLRQEACLRSGLKHINEAESRPATDLEFIAEDLRAALIDLRSLVGGVGVEDVLGEIFARFCIGK